GRLCGGGSATASAGDGEQRTGCAALSDHAQHHGGESQAPNAVESHGPGAGPGPADATPRTGRAVIPIAYATMRDHRRGRCGRGREKSGAEAARSEVDLRTED